NKNCHRRSRCRHLLVNRSEDRRLLMRALITVLAIFIMSITAIAQTPQPSVATPFGPQASPPPSGQQPVLPPGQMSAFLPADAPTRVFAIRYVDSRSIEKLVQTFGVPISREPGLNAIAVRGPEKTLDAIEEMIKRFDVPGNIPKR